MSILEPLLPSILILFIHYLRRIFVIGRPGSGVSNQIGFANKASSSSKNIGAIVGGAVGGTIGVAILLGLVFWLGRRSKRRPIHLHIGGTSEKDHEKVSVATDGQTSQLASISYYSPPGNAALPPPPKSARSANSGHPLMAAELQSPVSPALPTGSSASFPNTPNTPTNFLSMMSSSRGTEGYSPTSATAGQVTYNRLALANASQADNSTLLPSVGHSSQYGISPYILPASGSSSRLPSSKTHKTQPSNGTYDGRLIDVSVPVPESHQGTSAATATTPSGALVEPFVLSPAPRARVARYERKGSDPDSRAHGVDTPVPPAYYEAQGGNAAANNSLSPVSPTLVEYSPSTDQTQSRPTTGAY